MILLIYSMIAYIILAIIIIIQKKIFVDIEWRQIWIWTPVYGILGIIEDTKQCCKAP